MAFLCGCNPRAGVICGNHCQMQGCEGRDDGWDSRVDVRHTDACIRGERVPEAPEQIRTRLLPEAFRRTDIDTTSTTTGGSTP